MEKGDMTFLDRTDITAVVIADSVSPMGIRITTLQLRYPKMIHGEFMTHRCFSRNASSSRAIPVDKLIKSSVENAYIPTFRKNKPGMQPGEYFTEGHHYSAVGIWQEMIHSVTTGVSKLSSMGVHKQWANRPLEWFGWINVVVTSTEWSNFFALRLDTNEDGYPLAQDEMYILAKRMKEAMDASQPIAIAEGAWHLPYILPKEFLFKHLDTAIKCSVARCARVSYVTTEFKTPTVEEDLKLYDRLLSAQPIHASPAEHQATPDSKFPTFDSGWIAPHLHGNFRGWIQYRKTLPGECL